MEKSLEGTGKTPRIVQVMCFNGPPRQVNQQPDIGLTQQWEAQWQEFLNNAHVGWGNPQLTDAVPWDDAKTFLSSFEQVAEACRWPREEWVGRLLPALRGGVEQYFCRLDPRERQDYQKVKAAVVRADTFRTESKRQHFRQCCYQELEGPRQVYNQLQELCRQWLKPERHTKEQILELIIQEQLLAMLPPELRSWVQERGPEDCVEAVALAEDFLLGHRHTARPWEYQVPVPEMTTNTLEAKASQRQRCVGAVQKANEVPPTRNPDVVLPPEGQGVSGIGLMQEPVSVKEEPNLNQKHPCWELARENAGGSSSSHALGLLIPPPETIAQPGQQEATFAPRPENGEPIPNTPLGGRMLKEIKTEECQGGGSETDDSFDFPDRISPVLEMDQHSPGRNLHERVQWQGTSTRGGRKTVKRNGRYYPPEKRHVCSECGHKAYYLSDLLRHMKRHSKKLYKCSECGKTYKGKAPFEAHQKIHTASNNPKSTKGKVKTRNSKHQTKGGYICTECGVSKATLVGLTEHMKVHGEDKPYECPECGKAFKWQSNLTRHLHLHTYSQTLGKRRVTPGGAGNPGKNSGNSLPVQGTKLDSRRHSTDVISLRPAASEPGPISRLRLRKPLDEGRAPSARQGVKTLRVVLTKLANSRKGYKSDKLSELVNHMRVHTRKRPYKCHDCGRSFRWPSTLHQHRQNACPQKRPVLNASFAEHQATQTGEGSRGLENFVKQEIKLEDETLPDESYPHGKTIASSSNLGKQFVSIPVAPVAECDVTLSDDEELINILGKRLQRGGSKSVHQPGKGRPPRSTVIMKGSRYQRLEKKHECPDCGHRTYYLSDLLRHQRTHTGEKPYKCLACGKAFSQTSALYVHYKKQPSCSPAKAGRPAKRMKKRQGDKKYTCSRCGHKTYKLSTFLVHMRTHGGEKPFKCQDCGETFSSSSNLSRHQKLLHVLESSSSSRKPSFFKHRKRRQGSKKPKKAKGENPLPKKTGNALEVTTHNTPVIAMIRERWRYDKQEQKKDAVEEENEAVEQAKDNLSGKEAAVRARLVKFAYCKGAEAEPGQAELSTDDSAQVELSTNDAARAGEKPHYKCLTCKESFESQADLTDHENTHTEPKPNECSELRKCFSWDNNLLKQVHRGEKPHSCPECGKDFYWKDNLVTHLKTHGFENVYECAECEETFVQQELLERHQRSHAGQKS